MLGSTVPTVGGLDKAFYWADLWNCEVVQFYLTLSRTWKVNKLNKKQILDFKFAWKNSKVKEVVAHIPYLVNLASDKEEIRKKSIIRLIAEVERAELLGVKYLVLHPGSHGTLNKKAGLTQVIQGLNYCLEKSQNFSGEILLENMAGQGTSLGNVFADLSYIINSVKIKKLGICLDTCHLFAAGYDIRDKKNYQKTLEEFDSIIGIEKIKAIHFNDSKTDFKSNVDRHENIGEGKIGLPAFGFFMNDKRFKNIPKILEIPDIENNAKKTIKKLRLLEL